MNINELVRPNILKMKPYSSARDEFKGAANVFLDANENPYDSGLNRYPDPLAMAIKHELSKIKGVKPENMFIGNGSDEVIDVLIRIFCEPRVDNIVTLPPTYGMYEVSANTSDVEVLKINLSADFQLETDKILMVHPEKLGGGVNDKSKILFICNPNNPTGNSLDFQSIIFLLKNFKGIVVIDEAYIDFAKTPSFINQLDKHPNLVVMQTFSKAWGLAAVRCGMAFASTEIIALMNKVKPPYNVNDLTQKAVLKALRKKAQKEKMVKELLSEREKLVERLQQFTFVQHIYPSDANFVLVKVAQPNEMYNWLATNGVVVRNRTNVILCEGCLRLTVGTPFENEKLLQVMKESDFLIA
jgi:histidinol-phosphate aminotransferase